MSRVALASIKTLTLYDGKNTKSRRTAPVPQLECAGSVCRDYHPFAIQCTNAGGTHTDIDWKCEADLPSSLRFGRLQVSCEGWDRPGDPYVLQGSCGLTYSLIRTPSDSGTNYTYLFGILFALIALLLYISRRTQINPFASSSTHRGGTGGGGPTSTHSDSTRFGRAPPPYAKYASPNQSDPPTSSWAPGSGFWTGLGAGGLATSAYHYLNQPRSNPPPTWDWERPVYDTPGFGFGTRTSGAAYPESSAARRRDDGAGSSTGPGTRLGETRRATGFGGSSVR